MPAAQAGSDGGGGDGGDDDDNDNDGHSGGKDSGTSIPMLGRGLFLSFLPSLSERAPGSFEADLPCPFCHAGMRCHAMPCHAMPCWIAYAHLLPFSLLAVLTGPLLAKPS